MNGNQNMKTSDAITFRRSVRPYLSNDLRIETINSLLQDAVRAPTPMHQEPWRFIVIQDQALLNKISQIAKPLFEKSLHDIGHTKSYANHNLDDPSFDIFYDADTLIANPPIIFGTPIYLLYIRQKKIFGSGWETDSMVMEWAYIQIMKSF